MSSGVGLISSMYAGFIRHEQLDRAQRDKVLPGGRACLPVSVNHCQESGVGSAAGLAGSSDTTGKVAGTSP